MKQVQRAVDNLFAGSEHLLANKIREHYAIERVKEQLGIELKAISSRQLILIVYASAAS